MFYTCFGYGISPPFDKTKAPEIILGPTSLVLQHVFEEPYAKRI